MYLFVCPYLPTKTYWTSDLPKPAFGEGRQQRPKTSECARTEVFVAPDTSGYQSRRTWIHAWGRTACLQVWSPTHDGRGIVDTGNGARVQGRRVGREAGVGRVGLSKGTQKEPSPDLSFPPPPHADHLATDISIPPFHPSSILPGRSST